jgi:hypothetical protein
MRKVFAAQGPAAPRRTPAPPAWPSVFLHDVGTPEYLLSQGMDFATQYPACTSPCQRFAAAVTRGTRA